MAKLRFRVKSSGKTFSNAAQKSGHNDDNHWGTFRFLGPTLAQLNQDSHKEGLEICFFKNNSSHPGSSETLLIFYFPQSELPYPKSLKRLLSGRFVLSKPVLTLANHLFIFSILTTSQLITHSEILLWQLDSSYHIIFTTYLFLLLEKCDNVIPFLVF